MKARGTETMLDGGSHAWAVFKWNKDSVWAEIVREIKTKGTNKHIEK